MPAHSIDIRKGSELHQKLVKMLQSRILMALDEQQTKHQKWREAEERTLAFMPESENDMLRRF